MVGAGSLSFQMIEALVERLPVMVCPRWVATLTQPMAVDDVVAYLAAALDPPDTGSEVFEIGGATSSRTGTSCGICAAPRAAPLAAAGAVVDAAPVGSLARTRDTGAGPCRSRARGRVEEPDGGQIVSRIRRVPDRTDAVARGAGEGDRGRRSVTSEGRHADHCSGRAPVAGLFADQADWRHERLVLRELPLASARLAGPRFRRRGHGTRPSRSRNCGLTDVIDGWTVEAYEPDRRLRLRADLKLPGSGWLGFQVTPLDDGRRSLIRQTATFDPRGLLGRAYWYILLPVHEWMFSGLLHEIARRAKLRRIELNGEATECSTIGR